MRRIRHHIGIGGIMNGCDLAMPDPNRLMHHHHRGARIHEAHFRGPPCSDFVRDAGAWRATPLFLALILIECADLVFAIDSVPAIFAITQDPFIVYTSNIFAILGLRALYFALAAMIHRFAYLKYALALVLVFIGAKIFLVGIIGKIPPVISLSVTLGLLIGGVLLSLWKTRGQAPAEPQA